MHSEENIPESKKFRNQRLPKQFKINVQLISETSLDKQLCEKLSEDQKIQAVLQLKSIHLEWLNIRKIQNLQVFTNLNVLYLQHNKIAKIQHLECLVNLEYLALNDNLISCIEGLNTLKKLVGLNLNNNQIQDIAENCLPQSLQMLSLKDNPVTLDTNYKVDVIKQLPYLDLLDGVGIHPQEKLKISGKFPQKFLDYSEKLKHFRNKKQIKKKLGEESQPVYLGGVFEEEEAIKELREKTRKYMHIAKEGFISDMNDQNQNFQEKVKISRKVRNFKQNELQKSKVIHQIDQSKQED